METTIQKPKLLELEKKSSSYKLLVSPELEKKIRYYLDRFPSIEYSGTLFYTVSGSFETNDLVINAFDFLLQDIGTGAYTEFNQSPDVIGYMVEHPELLDETVYQGLMHSHHNMGAFFSGTDTSTLREEGSDRVHFVSLIIDTKGTYQAAITRVVVEEMKATGFIKYPTFNNKEVVGNPITYSFNRKKIEYFMLEVTRPELENPFQELSDRIKEVQEQKVKAAKAATPITYSTSKNESYTGYNNNYLDPYKSNNTVPTNGISYQTNVGRGNLSIPTNKNYEIPKNQLPFEEPDVDLDTPIPYGYVKVDHELIQELIAQLITGDVNYFMEEGVTLESLIPACESMFELRFPDKKLFHAWAEQYVEFLVYYTEDPKLEMYEDEVVAALIANDMSELLRKFITENGYIKSFVEILDRYII